MKIPPYLRKGDCIGITVPAGFMAKEKIEICIRVLQEEWGFRVKLGKTVDSQSQSYFSGTVAERLADLQAMLDDDELQAILCARGGYGCSHIIDALDFTKFKKKPKWLIGYSDITLLHCHLHAGYRIASLHAPMAAAFNDGGWENEYVQSLKKALMGKKANYAAEVHPKNRIGECAGPMVGGNLALLVHSLGTPSEIETKGKILFVEDIGEYIYAIDRMMMQLKRAGKLDKLKGLVVGKFTDLKDTDRPFGEDLESLIAQLVSENEYPVCFQFPIGHSDENVAIKIGETYHLKVGKRKVTLRQ